mgnify:FL=1
MSENKIEMTEDQLQEVQEAYYELGQKQLLVSQMREIIKQLGYPAESTVGVFIIEREEALIALRQKCQDAGKPSNFPDDLHLADIIQKYL